MGICIYCKQPAGFLRRRHKACEEQRRTAITMIPHFFSEVMESHIPPERFGELLQSAAQVSRLSPEEYKSLCVSGITTIIDSITQVRSLTAPEIQRTTEIADALSVGYPEGIGVDEKIIKASIISELYEGKIPDRISIVDPVPVEFGRGESILWVFNHVRSFQMSQEGNERNLALGPASPIDSRYFSTKMVNKSSIPKEQLSNEMQGDLILTNRNIFFLESENAHLRFPISRIMSLRPYAEGIYVACKPTMERSRAFLLDDPWFATNVISRLTQMARR